MVIYFLYITLMICISCTLIFLKYLTVDIFSSLLYIHITNNEYHMVMYVAFVLSITIYNVTREHHARMLHDVVILNLNLNHT